MSLTLYDHGMAPSPRRARILLAEKGVAHDTVQRRPDEGRATRRGLPGRINPLCTVPALQLEDGAVLADNAAIIAYAEARWPEPPLLGRTAAGEGAQVASWNWRIEFEGLMAIAEALRNSSPAMARTARCPGRWTTRRSPNWRPRPGPAAAASSRRWNPARRPRDGRRRRFQRGRHHRRGGGGLRAHRARQAGRRHPHLQRWRAAMAARPSMAL
jgi:glutathione S-transferase